MVEKVKITNSEAIDALENIAIDTIFDNPIEELALNHAIKVLREIEGTVDKFEYCGEIDDGEDYV